MTHQSWPEPETESFALDQLHPQPQPSGRWLLPTLVGVLLLLGAVGSFFGWRIASERTDSAGQTPPSASSQPTKPDLYTEEAACMILVPILTDAADIATQAAGDETKVDKAKLAKVTQDLRYHSERVPQSMSYDLQVQIGSLRQIEYLVNGQAHSIDFGRFSSSGIAIATRCRPYATD